MIEFEEYFGKILDGKIVACDKMRRISEILIERYLAPDEFHFDSAIATRHTKFIETFCKIPSGDVGKPLKLELFQKARLQALFGFVDDNNLRQYNECLIIEGRKNGKSTECASVEIDVLVNDKEGSPQIYNVATARDQALLGFTAAEKMVKQDAMLSRCIRKRQSDLYFHENFGTIKALASNTNSLDGLDVHCAVIDELAAIKDRDLYDLIKQAMGSRKQPLLFCITTNGYVREGIFDAQYEYATNVLNGTVRNKRFLPFIYELDDPSEWTDENKWIKANPGLDTIKSRVYLREMVQKAKDDASFKPTVLVKDFNVPQSGSSTWLPFEWIVNESTYSMEDISHSYAIGGCDLSSVYDLTCATLIIRKPERDELFVLQKYFIPQKKIDESLGADVKQVPYKVWEEQGWIEINEGAMVDYSKVTEWFVQMVNDYDIRPLWICYDRTLAGYWQEEMIDYGFEMEKTAQGAFTWSQPMKELGCALQDHKINYNNNPILRWCLANTGVKSLNKDGIESIQPVKMHKDRRIDGMVSLLNAYVGYVKHREEYMPYVR